MSSFANHDVIFLYNVKPHYSCHKLICQLYCHVLYFATGGAFCWAAFYWLLHCFSICKFN